MNYVTIHCDSGECYNLLRTDGLGGKPLFVFLRSLDVFYADYDDWRDTEVGEEIFQWFSVLDAESNQSLHQLAEALHHCYYLDEYSPSEYLLLSRVEGDAEKSRYWEQAYEHVQSLWTDIAVLRTSVTGLLELLSRTDLPNTNWYKPEDTLPDLEALNDT